MDQFFENKTEIKGGAKKGASRHQPACGGIFIWPHEERLLGKFSLTSITKGLFLLHNRNNYPYETFVDLIYKSYDLCLVNYQEISLSKKL